MTPATLLPLNVESWQTFMTIIILLMVVWLVLDILRSGLIWKPAPVSDDQRARDCPQRCADVREWDIEPPHTAHTAAELRRIYITLESRLTACHPATAHRRIRRSLASDLMQG